MSENPEQGSSIDRPEVASAMTDQTTSAGRMFAMKPWLAAVAGIVAIAIGFGLGSIGRADQAELNTTKSSLESSNAELQKAKIDLQASQADAQSLHDQVVAFQEKEAGLKQQAADLTAREKKVSAAEQIVAKNTIAEGVWTVGRDITAGTYIVSQAITDDCYWAIYASGSNQKDIIQNDNVSGGRPTVTLSAGQDFETARCGTWTKQ